MQHIDACPICASSARQQVYPSTPGAGEGSFRTLDPYSGHYQINRCGGCGLMFSSPIFDPDEVQALYENASHTNVLEGEEDNVKATMQGYYNLARPFLGARDRVLDVGCDVGFLLDAARQDGFKELFGTEPTPVARQKAERLPGARISPRFYEDEDYPGQHFDLITFIHVIDHLVDPGRVVTRAYEHLRPGGLVVGVVHDVESLLSRILRERFPPFNFYHHYFFSKTTLARLFERHGFEVISVTPTVNCYSFGFFLRRLPLLPDGLKRWLVAAFNSTGIGRVPLRLKVGNIGIVARRPLDEASAQAGSR
jgi:SAM-dependent methyltransferase